MGSDRRSGEIDSLIRRHACALVAPSELTVGSTRTTRDRRGRVSLEYYVQPPRKGPVERPDSAPRRVRFELRPLSATRRGGARPLATSPTTSTESQSTSPPLAEKSVVPELVTEKVL